MKSKLFDNNHKYLGELTISDVPNDLDIKKFKEEWEKLSREGGILVIDSELDCPAKIKSIPIKQCKK